MPISYAEAVASPRIVSVTAQAPKMKTGLRKYRPLDRTWDVLVQAVEKKRTKAGLNKWEEQDRTWMYWAKGLDEVKTLPTHVFTPEKRLKEPKGRKDAAHLLHLRISNPCKTSKNSDDRVPHVPRAYRDDAHLANNAISNPVKTKAITEKKMTVKQIIKAIMKKEEVKEQHMPKSPKMGSREANKLLGISEEHAFAISKQASPRLRAKAMSCAILNLRPLEMCAAEIRKHTARYENNAQHRQGY